MKRIALSIAGLGAVLVSAMAPVTPAFAHEPYFRANEASVCDDKWQLKAIRHRFKVEARKVHHRPDWRIAEITDIHQRRLIPQDVHKARPIAGRYCQATVHFNDGTHRAMWYLIESGAGFAAIGDKTQFCISGLDDWNVYNAHCRILREP